MDQTPHGSQQLLQMELMVAMVVKWLWLCQLSRNLEEFIPSSST